MNDGGADVDDDDDDGGDDDSGSLQWSIGNKAEKQVLVGKKLYQVRIWVVQWAVIVKRCLTTIDSHNTISHPCDISTAARHVNGKWLMV